MAGFAGKSLVAGLLSAFASSGFATEEFFVPLPEDHTLDFLTGISSDSSCGPGDSFGAPDPVNPVSTVTDFVVRVDGTIIVIDHFENDNAADPAFQYEADIAGIATGAVVPTDSSTRIYGDGILSNGAAPGVTTDAGDVLSQGQVVVFEEAINTATQILDVEITGAAITGGGVRTQDGLDGGDRIFATETINVTRAQWTGPTESPGTLFAGAFELFPLAQWGDSFTLPVGEDTGVTEFQWAGITVMAANDGTSVSIDANADGDFIDADDVNAQIINRGESIEVLGRNNTGGQTTGGLNQGARIFSSDIIQANIISGTECSNYASRWFTLFPDALLGNNYYEPVSTQLGDETRIFLYNPSPSPLTINFETTAGVQPAIVVPPMGVVSQVMPVDSGARFFTGSSATFGALTVTDQNDTAHDWGHASTSQRLMGNIVQVGYAEGDDPSTDDDLVADGGIGENAAPVWLIADNIVDTSDTQFEICVDVSGDGGPNTDPNTGLTFDYTFTLNRLDSARLYDGGLNTPNAVPAHIDGDQSGMLAFVCDGSDAILAAAWGQAPDTASPAAPAVDVGTTVRSVSADVAFIGDTVFEDVNDNGVRDPGEGGIQDVTVVLTPSPGVNLGSGPGQPITTVTDFNGSYLFPSLVNGDYTIEIIPPAGFMQTFDPDASNGDPLVLDNTSQPSIIDSSGRLDQDFGYVNEVPNGQIGDFIYSDVNGNGIQEPGELGIAGINVELCGGDIPFTTVATDDFNTIAYNNNSAQWASDWTELGDDAAGVPTDAIAGAFGNFDGFRIAVTGRNTLFIRGNATTAAGPSLTRQIDATGLSNLTVTLDLRAFTAGVFEADDLLFIQVSISGGAFSTIGTVAGSSLSAAVVPFSFNFDSLGSANVRIRLQVNGDTITNGGAIEGIEVDNISIASQSCLTQTTDAAGAYLFTGRGAGSYTVTVLNPPVGLQNTDDPNGNGDSSNTFSLNTNGGNLEQDFGYFTPATIIGHVYLDTNGNGVQEVGEPNIVGLDVLVTDSLGNLQTVTTDANGDYLALVPPGVAQVNIDDTDAEFPAGFIQTDGIDPNNVLAIAGLTVDAGDDGYFQGNTIGDTVYSEEFASSGLGSLGTQDGGDPGIPNVLVTLTPPPTVDLGLGAGVAISQFTDSNGNYSFVGLPDANYVVTVSQPSGSTQTEDPDGGNDNLSAVSISGGVTNNEQDFGYANNVPTGRIGDRVYTDTNGNGVQDAGELGIAGINVELCGDLDDNDGTVNTCRVETTDAQGDYLFGDLLTPDGSTADPLDTGIPATNGVEVYTVTILNPPVGQVNSEDPDNGLPNFSQLTLSSAGGNLDQDFGYFTPAIITGHLYIDTDGDGNQGAGEPDLVGVDVVITDVNGNQQTVSTDANGDYQASVPPGLTTANVDETDAQFPLNHQQTEGVDPSSVIAIAGSSTDIGIDGYAPAGLIGDKIFFDSNVAGTTGVFDPGIDAGIPAVTVTLASLSGADLGNGAGAAITTVTDANGNYSFGPLLADDYIVTVIPPSNVVATIDPNEAGVCTVCDSSSTITLAAGETNLLQDFGYQPQEPSGRIGDRIFSDLNGNGLQDINEPGLANIDVQLCGDLDDNDATAVTCRVERTDIDGNYLFGDSLEADGVTPDPADAGLPGTTGTEDYTVTVLNPPVGSVNTADPDGLTPSVAQLTLPLGFSNLDQDFGYVIRSSLSGTVWLDEDLDGILDIEETGITGTQVELSLGGLVIATTVTDANGDYSFPDILPGEYTVNVIDSTLPPGLQNTAGANGIDPRTVSVRPGEIVEDVNFGYIPNTNTGAIGDRVWFDANSNGIQDPGEAGIGDVSLSLANSDGSPVAGVGSVSTNENGDYLFTNVPFGNDYIVSIEPTDPELSGFTPTVGPQSEGGFIGNPVSLTATASVVTDIDFGFTAANSNTIVDSFWVDSDRDGVRDSNEQPIENVTATLFNDANSDGIADDADGNGQPDVVATTTSDATGGISFTGLPDGSYVIGVTDVNTQLTNFIGTTGEAAASLSDTVSVSGGQTDSQNSFGYNQPGLIAGTVYADTDSNADQNDGEAGVSGTTVTLLLDSDGNGSYETTVETVVTGADGSYEFNVNNGGEYRVVVTPPGGAQTEDPEGATDNQADISLANGQSSVGNDFGYDGIADLFNLSGTVFIDPDKDGIEDVGELGIEGVTLDLIDRNVLSAYDIVDGSVDINGDGRITVADDGQVNGVTIIDGMFDVDNNGSVDEADSGVVGPFNVLAGMVNLAQSGVALQSSTLGSRVASNAIDGITSSNSNLLTSHTTSDDPNEWWQIDLGSVQQIDEITIFNRDDCCQDRLGSVAVLLADTPFDTSGADATNLASAQANADFDAQIILPAVVTGDEVVDFNGVSARYIRLQKTIGGSAINILEVKITPSFIRATSTGIVATTTSDLLGNYSFTGLADGDYSVAVTDQAVRLAGFDITSGLDVIDRTIDGADEVDVDFGYIREESTASIAGEVFIDENDNGAPQDEEFDLSNVDVHLCRAPLDTGVTLPNGEVSFARYTGAFSNTTEIDTLGTLDLSAGTTASVFDFVGSDASGDNFGYIYQGFIDISTAGNYRFRTTSDDGTVVFIDGVEVVSNDGLHGNVTVTSADVDLSAGFHSIEVRYFERTGGATFVVEFEESGAGFSAIPAAALSSFTDMCNPSHPNFIETTRTDVNGEYIFRDLPPGQYVVDSDPEDIPPGLNKTVDPVTVNVSEGENVTDVDHGYRPTPIPGDPDGNNAGVLSGFVWVDVDANGVFDANEAPISGVTINVFRANGSVSSGPVLTATTGPDGSWLISNIVANLADDLFVTYQANDDTVNGQPVDGIDSAAGVNLNETQPTNFPIGDNIYNPVPLLSDEDNNIGNLNFGFDPGTTNLGSIRGSVYTDANQNGTLDGVSPTVDTELRDVSVNLLDADGNVIATTSTDANGEYMFIGLDVGDATTGVNYQVVITDNINVTRDLNPLETLPLLINLRDVAGSSSDPLVGVRNVVAQNAGFISDTDFFSIGNLFFFDDNRNGIAEDDEAGIAGVTVQCWLDVDQSETPNDASAASSSVVPEPGIDNLIRTVTTDENGEYVCTSLPNGNYIVVVADANGFDEAADGTVVTGASDDNAAKNWSYALTLGIDDPATVGIDESTQPNFSADFGVSGNNSISGTIFVEAESLVEPADGNTTIQAGDLDGVAGGPSPDSTVAGAPPADVTATQNVPVDLLLEQADGSFQVIQTVLTGADGSYTFPGLPDGRYQVRVRPSGTGIDAYGQTGDPDLAAIQTNPTDLVCDSSTAALCDNTAATPIDLDSGSADANAIDVAGVDFGYQRGFSTTPVTMNFFSATRSGSSVSFVWETSNEVGHAGFQVYARGEEDWELLNDELLVGNIDVSSDVETKLYSFEATTDAKWFALVDVSDSEEVIARGPFEVGQEYGTIIGESESFDWSSLELGSEQTLDEIRNSVNSKLDKRPIERGQSDPEFEKFLNELEQKDGE